MSNLNVASRIEWELHRLDQADLQRTAAIAWMLEEARTDQPRLLDRVARRVLLVVGTWLAARGVHRDLRRHVTFGWPIGAAEQRGTEIRRPRALGARPGRSPEQQASKVYH
jgi:hypothetical protein